MYEEDLRTLDRQIERARQQLQHTRSEWERYQLERKIMVYQDMRLDLLIQIEHYKPRQ